MFLMPLCLQDRPESLGRAVWLAHHNNTLIAIHSCSVGENWTRDAQILCNVVIVFFLLPSTTRPVWLQHSTCTRYVLPFLSSLILGTFFHSGLENPHSVDVCLCNHSGVCFVAERMRLVIPYRRGIVCSRISSNRHGQWCLSFSFWKHDFLIAW